MKCDCHRSISLSREGFNPDSEHTNHCGSLTNQGADMSDRDRIITGVSRLRRTRRLQLALEWAFRGLLYGALASAIVILVSKVWLLPIDPLWLAASMAAASLLGFILIGLLRPLS